MGTEFAYKSQLAVAGLVCVGPLPFVAFFPFLLPCAEMAGTVIYCFPCFPYFL